jgi:PAS domain S-box-containing protein
MKRPYFLAESVDRDEQFLALCAPLSAGAGALAALIGGLTLIGWFGGVESLLWAPEGMAVMKPNAAACFLLAGFALVILGSGHKGKPAAIVAAFFSMAVAAAAGATLVEYFTDWNPGIDQLLARGLTADTHTSHPGRMAPNSTVAFLFLGISLFLLSFRAGDWAVSVLAFMSGLVALHGMMGFAYASESRHDFFNYTYIAFPTALALMALSVGALLALGDRGMMAPLSRKSVGAIQARRMLPSMVAVPFLLAWLRHEGTHRGMFADEFGVALMVVASSAALAVVVWIGLLTINRSDLARSRTLESLKAEQRFRKAMEESILTGIVATDTGRRITYVNPAFCRLVGRKEGDVLGSVPPYPFVHPGERRSVFGMDHAAGEGHPLRDEFEFRLLHGEGRTVVVSAYMSALRDANGVVIGTLSAVTDITEKKRQERELARTIEILERIFANTHFGIAYLDSEFRYIRVNRAYADLCGYPPEHFAGRRHFELFPGGEAAEIFRKVVGSGEPHAAFAEPFSPPGRTDLGVLYRNWTLQPVQEPDGTVIGLIYWMHDVTQRMRAEASLKEMEAAMVQQGKMAVLGQMAAGIAHEIRNPLSGLNLYLASAEKLAAEAEFPDPDNLGTLMKSLATARAASVKIEGVIRRVMDFVKPAATRLVPVRINDVVSESLELVVTTARKEGVSIDAALADGNPECRADARLIEQLLLNLVTNAMQSLEKGEGEKRVEVSTGTEDGQVVIRVGDSGPGVREEDRGRIFDPFFTTKATGTGLGLSISSRIVADHGGSIDVGSSRLGGAEFRVRLPVLAPPAL